MGHFIAVCPAGPARALVGSRRRDVLKAFADGNSFPDRVPFAEKIIEGDLPAGTYPEASEYITAWQGLCAVAVAPFTCVEVYDNPDLFPEAWDFVWCADEIPGAPSSGIGGAAVGYRTDVATWINTFAALDLDALEARSGGRYAFELAELLRVLRDPLCVAGILIFWAE